MKLIGITARVDQIESYAERRDALDQRWFQLLSAAGYLPVLIPNSTELLDEYLSYFNLSGVLLSGGNSHLRYGGEAKERDVVDHQLIEYCIGKNLPLLGVCRGMQSIQIYFEHELHQVQNHVCKQQKIILDGDAVIKNSYHNWGTDKCQEPLVCWGYAEDGVVKAIKHKVLPITGIMWHPERNVPFEQNDLTLIKQVFK